VTQLGKKCLIVIDEWGAYSVSSMAIPVMEFQV
jgi:hypothetical protein